ncbi:hypothetical protein P691DRAFT_812632 [Macrolepiota fuliginosa MF-IS2]|uniref:Uncharacterized protein n=1 Tax=Macrolepiota fuliginosa MF-IS2 TaxID=1400762 RepID=A0A9P5XGJ3_9AGAR|nr:hypothetical protein P691DRAFT_812632 [Macrolepiota fuliginosa MF-IS2]
MFASSPIIIGAMVPAPDILGSLLWSHVQRGFRLSNITILTTLVLLAYLIQNGPIHAR